MNENPYQSPETISSAPETPEDPDRAEARRSVRIDLAILTVPAIYNFICFSLFVLISFDACFVVVNFVGLMMILGFVWFFGLYVFELVARVCHTVFSRKQTLPAWNAALYATFNRSIPHAIAGATIWTIWVFAFYQTDFEFYTFSIPIGVIAHVLAAGLYIPLAYHWFKVERSAKRNATG